MASDVYKKYLKAGKIARKCIEEGKKMCGEGVKYYDVVEKIENIIHKNGAKPAFPVNISVNEIGAHYCPYPGDTSTFKKGDLVKIDVGCHVDGYIADNALTVEIGTKRHRSLIKAAEEALDIAVKTIRPGMRTKDIGKNIETAIKSRGFRPIKNLTGHAVRRYELHAGLSIPNVPSGWDKVKKNMVIAIEPFATDGKGSVTNAQESEIYRLLKPRNIKGDDLQFYNWIKECFNYLPFASYWCADHSDNYKEKLNRLTNFGTAMRYPVLVEEKNGFVSQREHTVIIGSKGAKVITKL